MLRLDDYLYCVWRGKSYELTIKSRNMLGILGKIKEYFWGSREHAIEFLGTGELNKSEFEGTS